MNFLRRFFKTMGIVLLLLACGGKNNEQQKDQASFQPVTVNVDVRKFDGSYCFNCTLLNLVRAEGSILAVLKISNISGDVLYLKPAPEVGGDGQHFDFTSSYLSSEGKKFGLVEEFPSEPVFSGYEFLTGKNDDVLSNSEIFWLWFELVPPEIKKVDIIIPHIEPFNGIEILEELKGMSRVSTDQVGVECLIKKIEVTDQSTQITFSFIEKMDRLVMVSPNWQGVFGVSGVFEPGFSKMVASGETYEVLKVGSGKEASFLATRFKEKTWLNPMGTVEFWIKFPKLPDGIKTVTLLVPNCEPFVNVPISGPWIEIVKTEEQQLQELTTQIAVIKLKMKNMVEEVESEFASIQLDLEDKPSNEKIENVKNAVRNTIYEIKLIKDLVEEKSYLTDQTTGDRITLGVKFIEFWATGLKNYGIKKSKYSPQNGEFSLRVDEIFEKEFPKGLTQIREGEWKGAYEDKESNLIIPGLKYYLEQINKL